MLSTLNSCLLTKTLHLLYIYTLVTVSIKTNTLNSVQAKRAMSLFWKGKVFFTIHSTYLNQLIKKYISNISWENSTHFVRVPSGKQIKLFWSLKGNVSLQLLSRVWFPHLRQWRSDLLCWRSPKQLLDCAGNAPWEAGAAAEVRHSQQGHQQRSHRQWWPVEKGWRFCHEQQCTVYISWLNAP